MKICIDPGHGGRDPGAVSQRGVREKDLALQIALGLRDLLSKAGFEATMTREKDEALGGTTDADLQRRCNVANNFGADVNLSIHLNAGGGCGSEIYVYQDGGKVRPLAQGIVEAVGCIMGYHGEPVKDGSGLYVIRGTNMPSMLLEVGFMDSADIDKILSNLDKFAPLICKAFCTYYGVAGRDETQVSDQVVSDWAKPSWEKAIAKGIIKGDGDNFDPKATITREQFVVVLDRMGLL